MVGEVLGVLFRPDQSASKDRKVSGGLSWEKQDLFIDAYSDGRGGTATATVRITVI